MSLWENIKMALMSVKAHKMRSILTMLGIIIGVAAVIVVVAIGQGGEAMLKSQIAGDGNTIEVFYQPSEEEMQQGKWEENPFTQEDIRQLEGIEKVSNVVASSSEFSTARLREEEAETSITGINEAYLDVNQLKVEKGRSFTSADFLGGRRVAIVSAAMQEELFEGKSPIGEIIRIGVQPVEVIGVLEKPTGLFAFGSVETYIPWTAMRNMLGTSNYSQVTLQVENADDIQPIGERATTVLNQLHDTDDSYQVINMEEIAQGIGQVTTIMTTIIGSIAGISLLVGGIGVMNIMLVSVTERTREIGIRKSLGATRQQILLQFLVESIILTLIGGIIGIILGAGTAYLVSFFADWPSLISWQVVLGAVLFSMLIGIAFGLLPANKASRLDPIDSLRYE
ncbi:FtsX-like permease family protein [Bacillus hwajinpoensis]|uniref:FtsX-like permease family protein n=1 Tax=Guptibacillus hwajinpoensis TaxID=208199 RepID=A0A845F162_9BACL|nr:MULTISPECIES: ABC transporter permease [Bacillaceae]MYL64613.1 FtsX-like permease family protein [Pseudalkalibacillus hwajinpoensis]